MPISTLLILALLVGAAAWYWIRTAGSSRSSESQLHRICYGSRMQADRLIEGEMSRAPGVSRAEAARRAVERHRRDNR